jgi:GT2 family glycosyltransferase
MKDISVIIVSWNAREYLLKCLGALAEELADVEHEVLVVDNASTDGSPEAVEAAWPGTTLVRRSTNLGFARANNVGLRRSAGQYLLLVNSDVDVRPGSVKRLRAFLEQNPSVGIAGPRVLNADGTLQRSCRRRPSLTRCLARALALDGVFPGLTYCPHDAAGAVDVLSGCCWMVRREALEQVGPLDETFFMYYEDVDWCKRFADAGWGVAYVPEAEVTHYGGASSANAPVRYYVEMQRAGLQYWNKHHGKLRSRAYEVIAILHQVLRILLGAVQYLVQPSNREKAVYALKRSGACLGWLLSRRNRAAPGTASAELSA